MTTQKEVANSKYYLPVLDHGFIGIAQEELNDGTLVPAILGNDKSITRSARMSYGKGTRAVSDDRNLLRYLLRHRHTTPFEMATIKFHMKLPIFVSRQIIRHRTASVNEYSARYSILTDEFYIPESEHILPQSTNNKQGRAGDMNSAHKNQIKFMLEEHYKDSYKTYQTLLNGDNDPISDPDYPGLTRELARSVLPVAGYTEWYWQSNLHNIFRFLSLRQDKHAQYEVRVYANAMLRLIKPYFPIACEAYEDYVLNGIELSRMEVDIIKNIFEHQVSNFNDEKIREFYGLSKRELSEFKEKFNNK